MTVNADKLLHVNHLSEMGLDSTMKAYGDKVITTSPSESIALASALPEPPHSAAALSTRFYHRPAESRIRAETGVFPA
jgi:hypothetical protein